MNQPPSWPSDDDQPPKWPSGHQPKWPSRDDPSPWSSKDEPSPRPSEDEPSPRPSEDEPSRWPSRDDPSPWPSANQQPSWPSADQSPSSWPSADQPPGQGQPPFPGPGYTYGYGPRRPRYRRRRPLRGAIIGIVSVIILGSALRAIVHGGKSESNEPPVDVGPSATQTAAPEPVGSSFDLKDSSGNTYRVALVKVVDPAKGANQVISPDTGKRFVGLVFTVKAVSGSPQSEDANNDAIVIGGNGHNYSASFADIAGYSNFDNGALHVAQGDTQTGAVTVEVPDGVEVAKVQWTSQSGFGSIVQWITSAES